MRSRWAASLWTAATSTGTMASSPMLTEPDESYHGIIYTKQFGKAAYITKCAHPSDAGHRRSGRLRMNAFLLNLGLETLALRMERHCSNALKVAKYLESGSPGSLGELSGPEEQPIAMIWRKKYMPHGTCGVVSFGVKGGREAAAKFMDEPEAGLHCHPCGRSAHLRAPSRQHHPPSDERRAAGRRRACRAGSDPSVRGH